MTPEKLTALQNFYSDLLIYQYRGMPKAYATIQMVANQSLCDGLFFEFPTSFNLDTAVGAQLTIIGKIVGVPRNIFGINPWATYFNFTRATLPNPASTGFNRATTPSDADNILRAQVQNTYTCTDFELLNLIKIKIIYNNCYSSFSQLKKALWSYFEGDIDIISPDNGKTFFNFTRANGTPASVGFNRTNTHVDANYVMRTVQGGGVQPSIMQINYSVKEPYYVVMTIANFLNILPHSCGVAVSVTQL
jgi:hypothetical protein